jgi:hypothetical protein
MAKKAERIYSVGYKGVKMCANCGYQYQSGKLLYCEAHSNQRCKNVAAYCGGIKKLRKQVPHE